MLGVECDSTEEPRLWFSVSKKMLKAMVATVEAFAHRPARADLLTSLRHKTEDAEELHNPRRPDYILMLMATD